MVVCSEKLARKSAYKMIIRWCAFALKPRHGTRLRDGACVYRSCTIADEHILIVLH